MPRLSIGLLLLALLLAACGGGASGAKKTPVTTRTAAPLRTAAAATPTAGAAAGTPGVKVPNVAPDTSITLPAGFAAYAVAEGLRMPTSIALGPDGSTFVAEGGGTVYQLVDADGDGVFEDRTSVASVSGQLNGIMVAPDGTLFVSSTGKITTVSGGAENDIITGLPTGRHQNNGMDIGPDGKLYFTNGSTCDECTEQDPRSATIQQANIDGSGSRVYARGLRNPYDITFDDRGRLWASDNGSDAPCGTIDELNLIVDGGDYGWPYGPDGCDPLTDGIPPVADLGLHTAATGVAYYNGAQFPAAYAGNVFVTLWGDLGFTSDRAGRYLARVVIDESSGQPRGTTETWATGFTHPIDVVVDRDGSLLVADHGSGTLYRIVYSG